MSISDVVTVRRIAFAACLGSAVLWLAAGVMWSATGRSPPVVFVAMLTSWASYLGAHYATTGRFVDEEGDGDGPSHPGTRRATVVTVGALALMVVAFPVGIVGMHRESYPVIAAAAGLFVGGYAVGHYVLTGKPL